MKTGIITLVLIAMMSFSFTLSYADSPETKKTNDVKQTILGSIKYPQFAQDELIEGDVWVRLSINEDGTIKVSKIHSANDKLKKYVKDELAKMKLDVKDEDVNKEMDMKFTFKLY